MSKISPEFFKNEIIFGETILFYSIQYDRDDIQLLLTDILNLGLYTIYNILTEPRKVYLSLYINTLGYHIVNNNGLLCFCRTNGQIINWPTLNNININIRLQRILFSKRHKYLIGKDQHIYQDSFIKISNKLYYNIKEKLFCYKKQISKTHSQFKIYTLYKPEFIEYDIINNYIDNLRNDTNILNTLEQKNLYNIHYDFIIKEPAARIIQKKFLDWYYKPVCKDGSIGLNCKKARRELNLV